MKSKWYLFLSLFLLNCSGGDPNISKVSENLNNGTGGMYQVVNENSEGAAAWTGSELIMWSGMCGYTEFSTVGARYQPPAPTN